MSMVVAVDMTTVNPASIGLADTWQFRLGQCISHKDQSMPSLVLGRVKTSKGHEVYGVRSFATVDPNRDRMILGSALVDVAPGNIPCGECLLYRTSMCVGLPTG